MKNHYKMVIVLLLVLTFVLSVLYLYEYNYTKNQISTLTEAVRSLNFENDSLKLDNLENTILLTEYKRQNDILINKSKIDLYDIYTWDEIELLAATIWSESGNESYESQVWTAKTLLNRINSQYFPMTPTKVCYQGNGSQFNGTRRYNFGYYTDESLRALEIAFRSDFIPKNVVYFTNIKLAADSKFVNNVIIPNTIKVIGGHNYAIDTRIE